MNELKQYWRTWLWRDAVTKIITINSIVWLILSAVWLLFPDALSWCMSVITLPGTYVQWLNRPWTMLTYMFTQTDFLHLLVNMLWFVLFARLFNDLQGGQRTSILYIYGGIAGALTFLTINSTNGTSISTMYGSSCAVLAIIGAVAVLYPLISVNLMIFGQVRLLWLAVAAIILFAISWDSVASIAAHLTGLIIGLAYGIGKNKGIDITYPITYILAIINTKRVPTAVPYRPTKGHTRAEEEELDQLLAKVSRSGYASLTVKERQRLFVLSQKINR